MYVRSEGIDRFSFGKLRRAVRLRWKCRTIAIADSKMSVVEDSRVRIRIFPIIYDEFESHSFVIQSHGKIFPQYDRSRIKEHPLSGESSSLGGGCVPAS